MSFRLVKYLIPLICLARSSAQELFVFPDAALLGESDLRKLNCEVAPSAQHLEMLSPGVFKNSWFSLLLIVRHGAGERYVLDAGQNPAGTFELQMRRLVTGPESVLMEDVAVPFQGRIPEGQRCAVFVLDAWVRPDAAAERVKLEPAIWGGQDYWRRNPLEVRVLANTLPAPPAAFGTCTSTPQELVNSFAAGAVNGCAPRTLSCQLETPNRLESLLLRNLRQDLAAQGELKACAESPGVAPLPANLLKVRAKWASGK